MLRFRSLSRLPSTCRRLAEAACRCAALRVSVAAAAGLLGTTVFATSLTAQRTWVVDKFQRLGFDFADVQAAVDAASSGDVIRLRYTSTLAVDAYDAPTVGDKALLFAPEVGGARPNVRGPWSVTSLSAGRRVVVTGLRFMGIASQLLVGGFFATSCNGAIVLDDLRCDVHTALEFQGSNCALLCISRSVIASHYPVQVSGTHLVIQDSVIRMAPYTGFSISPNRAAVELNSSTLTMSNSALFGSDARVASEVGHPAVRSRQSEIFIGGGCTLVSGQEYGGGVFTSVVENSASPLVSTIHMDLDRTTAVGGWSPRFVYDVGPQTGLSLTKSGSSLHVDQYVHSASLAVLALGDLAATPWPSIAGNVMVAQAGLQLCFDWSVADMQLRRTFTIPPGLPATASVAMQAFELLPTGQYLRSNVAIAGNW